MTLVGRAGRFLREAIFDNALLKLVAITLSLGLYAFHHGAQNAQRTFSVSVLALLPEEARGRILLTPPPAAVRVSLRGARAVLDDLKTDDLGIVQLDVHKGTESSAVFDGTHLKTPAGVTATIEPAAMTDLVWDDLTSRKIPIQISLTGQPTAGFAVEGRPRAEPSDVVARGPRSVLETIQHVRAEPFDIGGLTEGAYPRKLHLDTPPSGIGFDASNAQVTVVIGRARLDRVYVKLAVQIVGVARGTAVPPEVDVRVSGPPEIVGTLRPEQIVPTVDVRSAGQAGQDVKASGSASLPVAVTVEGCTAQVVPASVVVKW